MTYQTNAAVRDEVSVYVKTLRVVFDLFEDKPRSTYDIWQKEFERAKNAKVKPRFSFRSVYRYLKALEHLGLAGEKERFWYALPPIQMNFKTEAEKVAAWEHSKLLVIGLEGILEEGWKGSSRALQTEMVRVADLDQEDGSEIESVYHYAFRKAFDINRFKLLAEEHLETSPEYQSIYTKLEEYRKFLADVSERLAHKYPDEIIQYVTEGISTSQVSADKTKKVAPWGWADTIPEEVTQVLKQKSVLHAELQSRIREIEQYVFLHEPLTGYCRACKHFGTPA